MARTASARYAASIMSLARALALSFRQLGDRAILVVLAKSLLITLAIFVLLGLGLWYALDAALKNWIAAQLPADYSVTFAGILALAIGLIGAWLLFRIIALFVLQFFADEVVRAVEDAHYPHLAGTARTIPFAEELRRGMRSGLRALAVNALALPFAIALLVTGVGTAVLFWVVNAVLLGRELQDMVWLRHQADDTMRAPVTAPERFALGGIVAAMLGLPVVNLIAPVVGAAAATHLVHGKTQHV